MATMKSNKGLGRGLEALLQGNGLSNNETLLRVNVSQLRPGKYQPRTLMDEVSLSELATSISTQGIIQPILARELPSGDYEIIAGERRWRAAQIAGLTQVPVLIRNVRDADALALAIIENIQREDLNPLEEALGIQRLISEFEMTHQVAADAVGRSRSAASNLLRLLNLPSFVQQMLMENKLDMGHARALLPLDAIQIEEAANKIVAEKLSVREAEKLVQQILKPSKKMIAPSVNDLNEELRLQLSEKLGASVQIKNAKNGAGKLVIEYSHENYLQELIARLK
jgi:ParB family chromosome partitioning protein